MSKENKAPETPGDENLKKEADPQNWRPTDHEHIRVDNEGHHHWHTGVPTERARSVWEM